MSQVIDEGTWYILYFEGRNTRIVSPFKSESKATEEAKIVANTKGTIVMVAHTTKLIKPTEEALLRRDVE